MPIYVCRKLACRYVRDASIVTLLLYSSIKHKCLNGDPQVLTTYKSKLFTLLSVIHAFCAARCFKLTSLFLSSFRQTNNWCAPKTSPHLTPFYIFHAYFHLPQHPICLIPILPQPQAFQTNLYTEPRYLLIFLCVYIPFFFWVLFYMNEFLSYVII